jgi:hypothetical protein
MCSLCRTLALLNTLACTSPMMRTSQTPPQIPRAMPTGHNPNPDDLACMSARKVTHQAELQAQPIMVDHVWSTEPSLLGDKFSTRWQLAGPPPH